MLIFEVLGEPFRKRGKMKQRNFGKTGLKVSEIGFGAWALGESWWGEQDDVRANVEKRLQSLKTDCIDILHLHSWTRAWNRQPEPFETLRQLRQEGKIRCIGVSTPEHDQNSVVDLIKGGWVDSVQVIFNLFEQEPVAEILPAAAEHGVGIIVRMAFDEGALTGKFTRRTVFPKGDFRADYFRGERLGRVEDRVEAIRKDLEGSGYCLPQAALKFSLGHPGVGTVIAGIRNRAQAEMNLAVSDLPDLPRELMEKLRRHNWRRGHLVCGPLVRAGPGRPWVAGGYALRQSSASGGALRRIGEADVRVLWTAGMDCASRGPGGTISGMEKDTRRLALVSVVAGIGAVTLIPVHAGVLTHRFASIPAAFREGLWAFSPADAGLNVLLFLPMGYLLAAAGEAPARHSWLRVGAIALAFSAAIECAQCLLPGRYPSLWDIVFNALGGALGGWVATYALGRTGAGFPLLRRPAESDFRS